MPLLEEACGVCVYVWLAHVHVWLGLEVFAAPVESSVFLFLLPTDPDVELSETSPAPALPASFSPW